jgi:choline dehydrogenase-like flavoprotein
VSSTRVDVLIVGAGLMGAGIARLLREAQPGARILMVDAGVNIGSVRGQHRHDAVEPDIWERYNERMSSGIQSAYVFGWSDEFGDSAATAVPGMYSMRALGDDTEQMPVAALGINNGGMGVHWSAATPWALGSEVPAFFEAEQWRADLATAQRLLLMNPHPYKNTFSTKLRERLNVLAASRLTPERPIIDMPTATPVGPDGRLQRTGPNRIFEPIRTDDDPNFQLWTDAQAYELQISGGSVVGARIRSITTGDEREVAADTVVVCADAMRTPQLLFASGIRPEALGRYLNEHAALSGAALIDLEAMGLSRDDIPDPEPTDYGVAQCWMPANEHDRPGMGQFYGVVHTDDDGAFLACTCGLGMYTRTEVRAENRLEFSEDEKDLLGMPKIRVHFSYSERDLANIEDTRSMQRLLGEGLGEFDQTKNAAMLKPGSSLHFTGTVRMGDTPDGTSVCDTNGAVWGVDGLYVAGCGTVPTALSCNVTMTGMALTARVARGILDRGARGYAARSPSPDIASRS